MVPVAGTYFSQANPEWLIAFLLPLFRRVTGCSRCAPEIALRKKSTDFIHGKHSLLCALHVRALRIGFGLDDVLEVCCDVGYDCLGLRTVVAMQMNDQIANIRQDVGRVEQLAVAFSQGLRLRTQAITLSNRRNDLWGDKLRGNE